MSFDSPLLFSDDLELLDDELVEELDDVPDELLDELDVDESSSFESSSCVSRWLVLSFSSSCDRFCLRYHPAV